MMKKGQGETIFVYLLTAVIAGLILMFGYSAIKSMGDKADKVTMVNFRTDMLNDVDTDSSFGTIKNHDYEVPEKYKRICFIDPTDPALVHVDCDTTVDPIVCDSWRTGAKENIFLLPGGEPFVSEPLSFPQNTQNYECIDIVNGQFKVRFEGKGKTTGVVKI